VGEPAQLIVDVFRLKVALWAMKVFVSGRSTIIFKKNIGFEVKNPVFFAF
jgi:hypothetical protein